VAIAAIVWRTDRLVPGGVYSPEDGFRIVNKRALCMDKAAAMNVEPGVMAAVDPPGTAEEMLQGREDVTHGQPSIPPTRCPGAAAPGAQDIGKRLKEMGIPGTLLRSAWPSTLLS